NDRYRADNNKLFFLSMSPRFFGTIAKHLKSENIIDGLGFEHLIIEKPFGSDLESACQLNEELMDSFREDQIFRIDHYLGKEMVENIYAIRFANPIIDRIWDRHSIHNIQITLAEQLGVEERGDYYDQSGALRDMVQNHALQILSLLTMDKPHSFSKHDIRAEKVKVFQSLKKPGPKELANHFVRGQYTANQDLPGYREEPKVNPDSMTETYFAGVFFLDSDRFRNIPIFIRTGKRLAEKATRVDIVFKQEETIFAEDL
ncbi:glucose-6-phosphate dehydrogenase (NADP(+)), partial [Streptococcus danieliae]|nr:glucose-6-phosphate dehydrogenase (NADP(+)) [Streptococcus danieliae]